MFKSTFLNIYRNIMRNSTYFCDTLIHTIRRQLGKKVDGENSHALRSMAVWSSQIFMSLLVNCSDSERYTAVQRS